MAWTAPRTWVNLEVVSHTIMNTHVRDNLTYLKDIQDGVDGQDLIWSRGSTDVSGRTATLRKARTSIGAPTIVAASDELGTLFWAGYDGGAYRSAAAIQAKVDGTPGASDMPGLLGFFTASDGGITLTERMRISAAGQVLVTDGSVSVPSLSFLNDTDTGAYRIGADDWALAAGGSLALELRKSGGVVQALVGAGAPSSPGLAFSGDADSGLTRFNPDDIGLVAGGDVVVWTRRVATVTQLGFHGSTPQAKPTVTGAKGGNAALTSLLSALNTIGLVTDSSS